MKSKTDSALIEFAEGLAYCPCCEGVRQCVRGCSIREDSQSADGRNRYETMLAARRALQQMMEVSNTGTKESVKVCK